MKSLAAAPVLLFVLGASLLFSQIPAELPGPASEHAWLKKFVGEWVTEAEATMGPGGGPMKCKGTLTSRSLGGLWIVNESHIDMAGVHVEGLQTLGYNPETKKYVGTWVDSAFNHLWTYEGHVNETGTTLFVEAEGPNMLEPGKTAMYRDVYEFVSDDEIKTLAQAQGPDKEWVTFMTGTAKRKK